MCEREKEKERERVIEKETERDRERETERETEREREQKSEGKRVNEDMPGLFVFEVEEFHRRGMCDGIIACVCVRERERERKREKKREREKERERMSRRGDTRSSCVWGRGISSPRDVSRKNCERLRDRGWASEF